MIGSLSLFTRYFWVTHLRRLGKTWAWHGTIRLTDLPLSWIDTGRSSYYRIKSSLFYSLYAMSRVVWARSPLWTKHAQRRQGVRRAEGTDGELLKISRFRGRGGEKSYSRFKWRHRRTRRRLTRVTGVGVPVFSQFHSDTTSLRNQLQDGSNNISSSSSSSSSSRPKVYPWRREFSGPHAHYLHPKGNNDRTLRVSIAFRFPSSRLVLNKKNTLLGDDYSSLW